MYKFHFLSKISLTVAISAISAISFVCLSTALLRGIADNYSIQAKTAMEQWLVEDDVDVDSLGQELNSVLEMDGSRGEHQNQLALYYHNCFRGVSECASDKEKSAELAELAYRKAIALRPQWSESYASFAILKKERGHLDTEFFTLVDQAIRLGSFEPATLVYVTQLLHERWHFFNNDQQTLMLNIYSNALNSANGKVRAAAKAAMLKMVSQYGVDLPSLYINTLYRVVVEAEVRLASSRVAIALVMWRAWNSAQKVTMLNSIREMASISSKNERLILKAAKERRLLSVVCATLPKTKITAKSCTNKRINRIFRSK